MAEEAAHGLGIVGVEEEVLLQILGTFEGARAVRALATGSLGLKSERVIDIGDHDGNNLMYF